MAEVYHEHTTQPVQSQSSGLGFLLGIILLLVVLFLLFWYGLPLLRGATQAPQIQVPGQIDVNVNQPAAPAQ